MNNKYEFQIIDTDNKLLEKYHIKYNKCYKYFIFRKDKQVIMIISKFIQNMYIEYLKIDDISDFKNVMDMLEELIDDGIIYYEYKLKNIKLLEYLKNNYQLEWGYLKNIPKRIDKRNVKSVKLAAEKEIEEIIKKEQLEDKALECFNQGLTYVYDSNNYINFYIYNDMNRANFNLIRYDDENKRKKLIRKMLQIVGKKNTYLLIFSKNEFYFFTSIGFHPIHCCFKIK